MAFQMKGSPCKLGTIQGTSGHSAFKQKAWIVKQVVKYGKKGYNLAKKLYEGTASSKKVAKAVEPIKKQKLLGEGGVIRTTTPELAGNITKPLDLTKPLTKHGSVSTEANLTWFGPKSKAGAYAQKNRQVFSANLQYSKPYHIPVDEKWTNESLKKIMDKGHDIIIAGKDQYSQIPLNKDVIKNLKRIK
jgi:hypothetical protein